MGSVIRRRVRITGLVQGVFFRDTCEREAKRRNVAGFVTNLSDGSVEAVFEGDPNAVEDMIDWARRGPPGASVDDVAVTEEGPENDDGFRVV